MAIKLFSWFPAGPYQVLDTDYDNYSVVYSCSHFLGVGTTEQMWIYTKKALEIGSSEYKKLKTKVFGVIDNKLNADGLYPQFTDTDNYLQPVQQGRNKCHYGI